MTWTPHKSIGEGILWDSSSKLVSIVFNNTIRVDGQWLFDVNMLKKIPHFRVEPDGALMPMTEAFEEARLRRIRRQVFDKWRSFTNKQLELARLTRRGPKRYTPRRVYEGKGVMLPYSFAFVPWIAVWSLIISMAFFTILYTFDYGADKSFEWLRSLLFSFFSDIICIQPFAVLFVALFCAFVIRRNDIEQLELVVDTRQDVDEDDLFTVAAERQAISVLRHEPVYRPPPEVQYHCMRHKRSCPGVCEHPLTLCLQVVVHVGYYLLHRFDGFCVCMRNCCILIHCDAKLCVNLDVTFPM